MKKTLSGIAVSVLILIGLIWFARPDSGDAPAVTAVSSSNLANGASALVVEEANNYDFGSISMAAGEVKHTFTIRNMGSDTVTVKKMYTSCMCTTASLMSGGKQFGPVGMPGHGAIPSVNIAINPGEEAEVEVVFDPAAHGPAGVGRIQRTVTLEQSAGEPVELIFAALVTP